MYWTIIFLIITGVANAIMDKLQFHFSKSIFNTQNEKLNNWFNPKNSWEKKWLKDENGNFVYQNGKKVERFWGSSTIFVFLTDAWHLAQFIMWTAISLAISFNINNLNIVNNLILQELIEITVIRSIILIFFSLFFKKILTK